MDSADTFLLKTLEIIITRKSLKYPAVRKLSQCVIKKTVYGFAKVPARHPVRVPARFVIEINATGPLIPGNYSAAA